MRTRIETLEHELSQAERRAGEAETEVEELRHALIRLRAGFRDEETLRKDRHLLASEALLPIAGVLGILLTLAVATALAPYQFHGTVQLDARGLSNFFYQVGEGGIWTLLITLACLPLAVLPSVASAGMHMRKRFGWYAAITAWSLWCVVCPPLGAYGIYALARKKVRDLFFVDAMSAPRVRVAAQVDEPSSTPSADEVIKRSQRERLQRARRRKAS